MSAPSADAAPRSPAPSLHATAPYPPMVYAAYVIGVLSIVTLFSQLDRQLPPLLVRPLRDTFAMSDTSFGLLQGYGFALVYAIAGLPLGRLIDRTSRRNLIICGVVLWSAMTVLSGYAQSYEQLFMARMGVGIGEACLAPAAYSIIADYVPPLRRGRAIAVYYVSLSIGAGASLLIGGLILRLLPSGGSLNVPLLGSVESWRLAFIYAGLPGVLLAPLMLTVREPMRRDELNDPASGGTDTIGALVAHISAHRATFLRLFLYPAAIAVIGYGALAWAPAFYERRFAIAPADSGPLLGALVAIGGLAGTLLSGVLSDRSLARGRRGARLHTVNLALTILLPCVAVWPLIPSQALSFMFIALIVFASSLAQAVAPVLIQDVTPNRMRGQMTAIYLLIAALAGMGLGPTIVGVATDTIFHDIHALPDALVLVCVPMAIVALLLTTTGVEAYTRTYSAMTGQEHAAQPAVGNPRQH